MPAAPDCSAARATERARASASASRSRLMSEKSKALDCPLGAPTAALPTRISADDDAGALRTAGPAAGPAARALAAATAGLAGGASARRASRSAPVASDGDSLRGEEESRAANGRAPLAMSDGLSKL
jgi:hypothetical protein